MSTTYKIHPAIGIARVGNSEDYYLGPVTAGGLPLEKDGKTEVTKFRDAAGGLRRQAARFQVFVYDAQSPQGRPVVAGEGNVKDIQWTVHVANKKAAWYEFQQLIGADGKHVNQDLRNPRTPVGQRNTLIIDPGPRTVAGRNSGGFPSGSVFDQGHAPQGYPANFPAKNLVPSNSDISTLGQLSADSQGRLDFRGGYGRSGSSTRWIVTKALLNVIADDKSLPASAIEGLRTIQDIGYDTEAEFKAALIQVFGDHIGSYLAPDVEALAYEQPRIDTYANNNFWWDDTSDGPVTATVILNDNSAMEVTPAWVMVAPPAYAPQILNMVTLYDTIYDAFVRGQSLAPALYGASGFNPNYVPNFQAEIRPILARPAAYQWVANINPQGTAGHDGVVQANGAPSNFFTFLREPGHENDPTPALMPKLAGDNPLLGEVNVADGPGSKYLTLTRTQYFLLGQFSKQMFSKQDPVNTLGPGEQWDRGVLENCVGGPFCPGIEMTWLCRDLSIYLEPFRLKPMLPSGTTGLQWNTEPTAGRGLQPGDATKYMALPWQADFNECSNQTTDHTNLWWWPAQRPYFVSFQGPDGTVAQGYWTRPDAANFIKDETMVYNWKDLGLILKQPPGSGPQFMEVERRAYEAPGGNR